MGRTSYECDGATAAFCMGCESVAVRDGAPRPRGFFRVTDKASLRARGVLTCVRACGWMGRCCGHDDAPEGAPLRSPPPVGSSLKTRISGETRAVRRVVCAKAQVALHPHTFRRSRAGRRGGLFRRCCWQSVAVPHGARGRGEHATHRARTGRGSVREVERRDTKEIEKGGNGFFQLGRVPGAGVGCAFELFLIHRAVLRLGASPDAGRALCSRGAQASGLHERMATDVFLVERAQGTMD